MSSNNSNQSSNKTSTSHHTSTFSSFSTSSSSVTHNGATTSRSETTYSDPSGTRIRRTSQEPGQALREEREEYDANGRRLESGQGSARRIEDVSDEQEGKDREYEERMEDEYAKREGGA
ncbi:hypothetical protein IQ07DRAFT_589982 [Pyrenochaeta sp. DS3sAY3a]|nr:hypothetical protein IQ07DRAFT_589982 [Pyrenochaeta sp. DS3sAY3a]